MADLIRQINPDLIVGLGPVKTGSDKTQNMQ